MFKKVSEAYDILSDEEKRKTYDQFGMDVIKNQAQGEVVTLYFLPSLLLG